MNKRRRILCPTDSKNNKARNYPNNKNFQGNKNNTPNN